MLASFTGLYLIKQAESLLVLNIASLQNLPIPDKTKYSTQCQYKPL